MAQARRWTAVALIVVCGLGGCGEPDAVDSDQCGEPLRAEPGELRTVLRADWFDTDASLDSVAALPDGRVLVSYDTNPDEAGDADNLAGEKEQPGLVVLDQEGSCERYDRPEVDGRQVALDARAVAVDGEDRLYLWDGSADRLVRGPVGGAWETVTTIPETDQRWGLSAVAVDQSGEVFLATGYAISTVSADGTLKTIAGTGEEYRYQTNGPVELPRPATSAPLPDVRDIQALPSGDVLLTTKSSVLRLEDCTRHLLADGETTSGQQGAINRDSWLGGLAVLPSGDVLVSDLPGKRILRLHDGQSSVFLTDESYLTTDWATPALADGSGLLVHREETLAVYGLPAN
jgi:hypothetical protein